MKWMEIFLYYVAPRILRFDKTEVLGNQYKY